MPSRVSDPSAGPHSTFDSLRKCKLTGHLRISAMRQFKIVETEISNRSRPWMGVELTAENQRLLALAVSEGLDGEHLVRQCLRLPLADPSEFSEVVTQRTGGLPGHVCGIRSEG